MSENATFEGDPVSPSEKGKQPEIEAEPDHNDGAKADEGNHSAEAVDDNVDVEDLMASIQDQDDLAQAIGRQASAMMNQQADEKDKQRMLKAQNERDKLVAQNKQLSQRLQQPGSSHVKNPIRADIQRNEERISQLEDDIGQIQARIEERHISALAKDAESTVPSTAQRADESRRDYLIRTGKITPFSRIRQEPKLPNSIADVLLGAEAQGGEEDEEEEDSEVAEVVDQPKSHRNLVRPGFKPVSAPSTATATPATISSPEPSKKRRRLTNRRDIASATATPSADEASEDLDDDYTPEKKKRKTTTATKKASKGRRKGSDESEFEDDFVVEEDSDEYDMTDLPPAKPRAKAKTKTKGKASADTSEAEDITAIDDGDESVYKARLEKWCRERRLAREKAQSQGADSSERREDEEADGESTAKAEWNEPHPTVPSHEYEGGLKIPGDIYPALFDYQKTGVKWLWELHQQETGGIIADEMGLGKTIQIIAFLAALHHSNMLDKPVLVVCPATVMSQWVNEFHSWWPALRVSILHTSGSGMMDVRSEERMERDLEQDNFTASTKLTSQKKAARRIVNRVIKEGHVLVTTYTGMQTYAEYIIPTEWGYAILDEGHKIRNPDAQITIFCKELQTRHRIILSGTPIQNKLTELWSLFDFVAPMRLGTLVDFQNTFDFPIKQGGYANSDNLAVETALQCATVLKETVGPYLLQRYKKDVAADLPKKTEKVVAVKLLPSQRRRYEEYLNSKDAERILSGQQRSLTGIDALRKICNHPDLLAHDRLHGPNYGDPKLSSKMVVTESLLRHFKSGGHKTLLFTQYRIMADILEKFLKGMEGIRFCRMDGQTSIKNRQALVDRFNTDPNLDVFLLTTKVGGLGVNLTGADRIIIYDPDWNPATDSQARERAWRLGQQRDVEIYRLMISGTIEEKIYHRQLFKQFLSTKVLQDPTQRQTFSPKDLKDLFSLGDDSGETETARMFKNAETRIKKSQNPSAPAQDVPDDISKLSGVNRVEELQTDDDPKGELRQGDSAILATVFANSGVHSTFEHDNILLSNSAKKASATEVRYIRELAKKAADKAARELKEASKNADQVPIGTPTWTGSSGLAGRRLGGGGLGSSSRRGPSSASVLANLSTRQGGNVRNPRKRVVQGKELMDMVLRFMRTHGGSVVSQMLIEHFHFLDGGPEQSEAFNATVKRVATLRYPPGSRAGSGRGRWTLKPEFQEPPRD